MQGMWSLDEWDQTANFIVMDDIPLQFMASRKQFWGCQKDFVVQDKYRAKRRIGGGKPLIFIGNEDQVPRDAKNDKGDHLFRFSDLEWMEGNMIHVKITENMFA